MNSSERIISGLVIALALIGFGALGIQCYRHTEPCVSPPAFTQVSAGRDFVVGIDKQGRTWRTYNMSGCWEQISP